MFPQFVSLARTIALFATLEVACPFSGLGQEVTWPPAPLPPGANPALTATPRFDWLDRAQRNVDTAKGKHYDLIFDGDSITDNWQGVGKLVWSQHYVPLNAVDFGIGGDKIENVLWRLQRGQVDGMDPKLIVLMIGTNNAGRDSSAQIVEGIKALVPEYLKRCPDSHLLLLGIFPHGASPTDGTRIKIVEINKQIAALDDGKRVTYLDIGAKFLDDKGVLSTDIMPDLLHPSAKGYEIWADAIQPVINQYFPPTAAVK